MLDEPVVVGGGGRDGWWGSKEHAVDVGCGECIIDSMYIWKSNIQFQTVVAVTRNKMHSSISIDQITFFKIYITTLFLFLDLF